MSRTDADRIEVLQLTVRHFIRRAARARDDLERRILRMAVIEAERQLSDAEGCPR